MREAQIFKNKIRKGREMNEREIDSPLMTNAEAMAYCRIKDPRVWRRGYLERAFSAICSGRLYPVFSRQTNPIAISILKASCSLKESFRARPLSFDTPWTP